MTRKIPAPNKPKVCIIPEFSEIWVQYNWVPYTTRNPRGAALLGRKERRGHAYIIRPLTTKQAEVFCQVLVSGS